MTFKITQQQAETFRALRALPDDLRSEMRKTLWAAIRAEHDIPEGTRLKVEVDEVDNPRYLQLRNADTGVYLQDAATPDTPAPTEDSVQINWGAGQPALPPADHPVFGLIKRLADAIDGAQNVLVVVHA